MTWDLKLTLTTSECPLLAAVHKDVSPVLSIKSTLAPLLSNTLIGAEHDVLQLEVSSKLSASREISIHT